MFCLLFFGIWRGVSFLGWGGVVFVLWVLCFLFVFWVVVLFCLFCCVGGFFFGVAVYFVVGCDLLVLFALFYFSPLLGCGGVGWCCVCVGCRLGFCLGFLLCFCYLVFVVLFRLGFFVLCFGILFVGWGLWWVFR